MSLSYSPVGKTFQASWSTSKCFFFSSAQCTKWQVHTNPFLYLDLRESLSSLSSTVLCLVWSSQFFSCITPLLMPACDGIHIILEKYCEPQMGTIPQDRLEWRHGPDNSGETGWVPQQWMQAKNPPPKTLVESDSRKEEEAWNICY